MAAHPPSRTDQIDQYHIAAPTTDSAGPAPAPWREAGPPNHHAPARGAGSGGTTGAALTPASTGVLPTTASTAPTAGAVLGARQQVTSPRTNGADAHGGGSNGAAPTSGTSGVTSGGTTSAAPTARAAHGAAHAAAYGGSNVNGQTFDHQAAYGASNAGAAATNGGAPPPAAFGNGGGAPRSRASPPGPATLSPPGTLAPPGGGRAPAPGGAPPPAVSGNGGGAPRSHASPPNTTGVPRRDTAGVPPHASPPGWETSLRENGRPSGDGADRERPLPSGSRDRGEAIRHLFATLSPPREGEGGGVQSARGGGGRDMSFASPPAPATLSPPRAALASNGSNAINGSNASMGEGRDHASMGEHGRAAETRRLVEHGRAPLASGGRGLASLQHSSSRSAHAEARGVLSGGQSEGRGLGSLHAWGGAGREREGPHAAPADWAAIRARPSRAAPPNTSTQVRLPHRYTKERLCVSLNSRLESNKEEEETPNHCFVENPNQVRTSPKEDLSTSLSLALSLSRSLSLSLSLSPHLYLSFCVTHPLSLSLYQSR